MKRTVIGAVAGLAIWFGSALAAEAQVIQPTGPMNIQAGTNSWNFTADISIPTPMNIKVVVNIYKNDIFQTMFTQNVPNPGVQNFTFSQICNVSFNVSSGDVVSFRAQLLWNRTTTNAQNWNVTVSPTRPPSSVTRQTPAPVKRSTSTMAVATEWRRD